MMPQKNASFRKRFCRCFFLSLCMMTLQLACLYCVTAEESLTLTNGCTISGKILNPEETLRKTWQVQLAKGAVVELQPRTAVERVPMQNVAIPQYFEKVPFIPESVETHLQLAELCRHQNLENLATLHYERVLELDSENNVARQALNHRKIDGEWTTYEEEMLRKGYVKTKRGNWTTPQKLMIDERRVQVGTGPSEASRKTMDIVAQLTSPDARDVAQALDALNDPAAVSVLAKTLKAEQDPKLRDTYIRALSQIGNGPAFYEISQWAMQESDEDVCWTCITMLRSVPGMSKYIIPYLNHKENATVNRAAYILGRLGDRAAIPALINVLITEHKIEVRRGDPTLSQYTGSGNNSFVGQQNLKSETATELVSNREVLVALETLTGENFRYDIPAWWDWWASQNRVTEFDARRGSYDN